MTLAEGILALIAAGGGGAVIAVTIVRSFGEKWLDNKFANRLQELRHEHERQIELIRLRSSQSLDRSTRLAEREFDVTAEAWSLVTDAMVKALRALPGFRQSNDFSKLSDELTKVVLEKSDFEKWEIQELLDTPRANRNAYFADRRTVHEIADAKYSIGKADGHLTRNALFLDENIREELSEFLHWAWQAMVAWEIVREVRGQGPDALEGIVRNDEEFRKGAEDRLKKIETLVRGRFWPPVPENDAVN